MCRFGLHVFQLECIFKMEKIKEDSISLPTNIGIKGSSSAVFHPTPEYGASLSSPSPRLQVLRFVQEWNSLTAMKQKLLRRSGLLFHSPIFGLQQLAAAQRPHSSTKRSVCGWEHVLEGKLVNLTFRKCDYD